MKLFTLVLLAVGATALPKRDSNTSTSLADPEYGPIPGESDLYDNYTAKATPFPANITSPVPATEVGPPGPDDVLFQNLLSAEWAIFWLYQQAVEAFNVTSFTELGLPNTTYDRVINIRDNEAGHLRIFQDSISATSLKPGSCVYDFGWTNASDWLYLQVVIEVTSMAFLTGLVREAELDSTASALVAIGEVESRHNTWALIDIWNSNPFAGPSDTVFPYANQILDVTNQFIVPGSCPAGNPVYPSPRQNLPRTTAVIDANMATFQFTDATNQPDWYWQQADREYFAVFFHGVNNISKPFDTKTNQSAYATEFDTGEGIVLAVIANEAGAPTLDSVVAGPAVIVNQPAV